MNKLIAEKCNDCGMLMAGNLHQMSPCAMKVIEKLKDLNRQLNYDLGQAQDAYDRVIAENEKWIATVDDANDNCDYWRGEMERLQKEIDNRVTISDG